jgi:hypothetical protein
LKFDTIPMHTINNFTSIFCVISIMMWLEVAYIHLRIYFIRALLL